MLHVTKCANTYFPFQFLLQTLSLMGIVENQASHDIDHISCAWLKTKFPLTYITLLDVGRKPTYH
jgi:hypothetical protein